MSTRELVVCHDGRVIPVPSGVYVHDRPATEPIDLAMLATVLVTRPLETTVLVHPARDAERSTVVLRYLAGLPPHARADLTVKLVLAPGQVLDLREVEDLSDLYDLPLLLPVWEHLRESPRVVPKNAEGREVGWDEAVHVALLTRAQAADRAALLAAQRSVLSGEPPSTARLADWSSRSAEIRDDLRVVPVVSGGSTPGTAVHAFGAYLARFGRPEHAARAVPPNTAERLREVVGGTFEKSDPKQLARARALAPGASVLVSFTPSPGRPEGVAWLHVAEDGSGDVRVEPSLEDLFGVTGEEAEARLTTVLSDPSTRVMPIGADSRPATMADLTGRLVEPREVAPAVMKTGREASRMPPVPRTGNLIVAMQTGAVPDNVVDDPARLIPRSWSDVQDMLAHFESRWPGLAQRTTALLSANRRADRNLVETARAALAAVRPVTALGNGALTDTPEHRDDIRNFVRAYDFATLRVADVLGRRSPLPPAPAAFGLPPAGTSAGAGRPAAPQRSETDVVGAQVPPDSMLDRIKDALVPLDEAMSRFADQLPDSPSKQQIQDRWNEFRTDVENLPDDAGAQPVKDILRRYSDLRGQSASLATREKVAPPLPRRVFLVADLAAVLPDIQAQVLHKVADAQFLTGVFKNLMNDRVFAHRPEKFRVMRDYYLIRHELHEIEDLAEDLRQLYVQPGLGLVAGRKFLEKVPDRLAHFTTEATKLVSRAQARIEWVAAKIPVDAADSKLKQQLTVAMNILNSAGSALSVGLLPTGFSWAPATVTFATDLARLAVLSGVKHAQTKQFLADRSMDAIYQIHSDDPLTRAKAQAQQAKDYFKLLLEAIEIGANVWPAWPTLQGLINTAVNELIDARVREAERQIKGLPKPTALQSVDGLWKSFLTETKEKFTDAGAWKTVTEGIKGSATEFGITGSFASVLAKPLAEKILDHLPLAPAKTLTGEHLRNLVDNVGSLSGADTVRPQPTVGPPVPTERIPDDVLRQDRFGRRVYDYRAAQSNEKRAHVALNFYGSLVWGKLERNGNFTPEYLDRSSYVDEETVQRRIINRNSYIEGGNEVRGTWYKPFAATNDYLFVRDRDGGWEWFHEMSVPAHGRTGRNNIHHVLSADEHKSWISPEPFDWNPPANSWLIVDFDGNRPILDNQAHQLAWYMAHRVLERVGAGSADRPRLHLEAGSLGSRKRAQMSEVKHSFGRSDVSNPRAEAISRERAGSLRAEFFRLLDRQLKAQADERNIAADDIPRVNELLAEPHIRGAGLWRSRAPEALREEAGKLSTHPKRTSVSLKDSAELALVWTEHLDTDVHARPDWFHQAVQHLEPPDAKSGPVTTAPAPAARHLDPSRPVPRSGSPRPGTAGRAPADTGPARPVRDTATSIADDATSEAWQYLVVNKVPLDRDLVNVIKGAVEPLSEAVQRALEVLPPSPDHAAMTAAWAGFRNDVKFLEPDSASVGSVLSSYAHTYALWTEVARARDVPNPLPRSLALVAGFAGELVTAMVQVDRKVGDGRFLKGVMLDVPRNPLFKDHPMERFHAFAGFVKARHELHKVEDYAARLRLLYGSSREGVPDAKKVVGDFITVMEDFTRKTTELSGETQQAIEWLAAAANAGATETDLEKKVGLWMNVLNSGLSGMSVALAPTGWGWAPATTTLLTDLARTAVMRAVDMAEARQLQRDTSGAGIFAIHDDNPLTVARAHYQTAKTLFRLTLEAIEVGAHVWPAWPLVPGVLGPLFDQWIDKRLEAAERQLKGLSKPAADEILKQGWKSFIEETKAKFSEAGFWKTAVEQASKGGATPYAWIGSLVSQLAKPLLGAVLDALPIRPAFAVTGKQMKELVENLGSLSTDGTVRPEPTKAKQQPPLHPIPDRLVGGQDRYGRRIQAYRPARTGEQGDQVALNFHGSLVWGKLDRNGNFRPEEVDPSSKLDAATLQQRILTQNSYIDAGAVEVRGTWYRPFKGKQNEFDYLFVRDSDGGWEWFPAMGVTGGGTNKYSHVHVILSDDKHEKWVSTDQIAWNPPAAGRSIIDFGNGDEPRLTPQSHELLADIARKVIERKEIEKAGGPAPSMPRVRLEAGAMGSWMIGHFSELTQRMGWTELDNPEALENSQRRATNLKDQVTHALDRQLEAYAVERGLTHDEFDQLPKAADLVAEPHARGAGLTHSEAADDLKAEAVERTTHPHRNTESLADSSNLGFLWTENYAPVTGNRPIAGVLADVHTADDESIGRLAEALRAMLAQSRQDIEDRFGDDVPLAWKRFVTSVEALDPANRASVFTAVNAYDFGRTAVNKVSKLGLPDVGRVVSAGLGFEGAAGQDVLQVNVMLSPDGWNREDWTPQPTDSAPASLPGLLTGRSIVGVLPHVVGRAPDGSYVVARKPPAGSDAQHGFTGFDVYGPDGKPRGGVDARTIEGENFVATSALSNHSEVPGALDLATFFAATRSTKNFFQSMSVINEKVQQIREELYRMDQLPSSQAGSRDYRQLRTTTAATARRRLEEAGWTLAPNSGITGEDLRNASWKPTGPGDGGPASADILTPTDARHFYQVATSTSWTAATGAPTRAWHWVAKRAGTRTPAQKATEFVRHIIKSGQRLRDDVLLPGYGLYRATVDNRTILLRAAVDESGNVTRVRRALPFDNHLQRYDGHDVLSDLIRDGWTLRSAHTSAVDPDEKHLDLDFFSGTAWAKLAEAHRLANDVRADPESVPTAARPLDTAPASLAAAELMVDRVLDVMARRWPTWEGVPDCDIRVGGVLRALGAPGSVDDTTRGTDMIVKSLGDGWFGQPGGLDRLIGLSPGWLTPVWTQPPDGPTRSLDASDRAPHLALIMRISGGRFVLLETQRPAPLPGERDTRRIDFELSGDPEDLPRILRRPVRLVVDADGALRQLDPVSGQVRSALPGTGEPSTLDRTQDAVSDPARSRQAPGLIGEELEMVTRIGPDTTSKRDPRGWSGKTIARIPQLGITLKIDSRTIATGGSGITYGSVGLAERAGEQDIVKKKRYVVEVVTKEAAALPHELASGITSARDRHEYKKMVAKWIERAGERGLRTSEAIHPAENDFSRNLIDEFVREQQAVSTAAGNYASTVRHALTRQANAQVRMDEELYTPPNLHPARFKHQLTMGVPVAAVPRLLQVAQQSEPSHVARFINHVQNVALKVSDSRARSFVRSFLQPGMVLSKADENAVLEFEEAQGVKGAVSAGLTIGMVLAYGADELRNRVFPETEEGDHRNPLEKNLFWSHLRNAMAGVFSTMTPVAQRYVRRHANYLIDRIADAVEQNDRNLASLGEDGDRWIDRRINVPDEDEDDITTRDLLKELFTGEASIWPPDLFGGMSWYPVDPASGDEFELLLFERRHLIEYLSMLGMLPSRIMTLDATDANLEASIALENDLYQHARNARDLSRRAGGIAAAVSRMSFVDAPQGLYDPVVYSHPGMAPGAPSVAPQQLHSQLQGPPLLYPHVAPAAAPFTPPVHYPHPPYAQPAQAPNVVPPYYSAPPQVFPQQAAQAPPFGPTHVYPHQAYVPPEQHVYPQPQQPQRFGPQGNFDPNAFPDQSYSGPPGGWNPQAWVVQLPPGAPHALTAAMAPLAGLPEPALRAFAERLRTELTRLRDQASGDSAGSRPDGRVLDPPAGGSIDSVREQIGTMLAEYDSAAGRGEGPQALPPVGDLVSRLLAAPTPDDVDNDESSLMRFGPVQRVYTPAGLRLLHEDDAHDVATFDALPSSADYRVGVHSHAHQVQAGRHLYSPETVAQQIVEDPKWTGQNITIIACEPSPAFVRKVFEQVLRLAPDRRGFSVTGGLGSVWITPKGHVFVAKSRFTSDERIRPGRFLTGDSWVSYTDGPDGAVTETRHQQPHLPGSVAPTMADIEAADSVWRLGFEVEVAVEIDLRSGRYGTIPHQTKIAESDFFIFMTETTTRWDAQGNSSSVHIIEIVSKPAAVWPGEQGPPVRDVLAQLKQIVQHMHNLPAGSRFNLGGVLSWVPGIRFRQVPGISGAPHERSGDKIQMIGGKFKSPNTQWTSGIPHLSNLANFLRFATGQSTEPGDQVARTFANDGLDVGRRAAQDYFRQYAKGRALPWRENELTGYLAATFPLVGAALHSLVRANLEEGVSKNAVLVAPRKEIPVMRSSLPPVLKRFLRDRGLDIKALIGSYLPTYDPLGNAQARRFIAGNDYLQIALVSVVTDNVVFGNTYNDGSTVPAFTLSQLGIGGTDNADPAYINPFELRRLAKSNGELPTIEEQTNDLIAMINGYAAAPALRPGVHQDVTALYNVNTAILNENTRLQAAQTGIRNRVGMLAYPPGDARTQQENHTVLQGALTEAHAIVASASENKAFAQDARTAADRDFPVGDVYRDGAATNLTAAQATLDEARQLVTTLDGMVQNNVVVYQPPYGGHGNQGGGFNGAGGAPGWSGHAPNYQYGGQSYQSGPQYGYGGWPPGGYNQQTWFLQVPDSMPASLSAALAPLTGLEESTLRTLADRLRTELTRLREQIPGDLVDRLPDGRMLDSPARASISALRHQIRDILGEYDFAVSTGKNSFALPSAGDLVAGLLAAPQPVLRAPAGLEWGDGVLPLGDVTGEQRAEAVRSAADMPRPMVLLGPAAGDVKKQQLLDDLRQALRWSAQDGVQPVVHVLPEADFPDLQDAMKKLRTNFKTVTVQRVSLGLNDKWALLGPDGAEVATAEKAATLFKKVGGLPVTPTGHEQTPVVRNWRTLTDPAEIERYLRSHLTELRKQPELVPVEDMGPHYTMLQLLLRNGGPADPAEPRFVPERAALRGEIAPLQLDVVNKPVPQAFALDYLAPKKSLEERKAWNDQLVQMVDLRTPEEINRTGIQGLAIEEMMALATHTNDEIPGGENANFSRGMATAFHGLAKVLMIPQEHLDLPTDQIPGFTDLMRGVVNCDISPAARQILLHQIDEVRNRLNALNQYARAGLVEVLNYTIHNC